MKPRALAAAAIAVIVPLGAIAQSAFTALHPERQYPDPPAQSSAHPYSELIIRVQQALRASGFDAGPPNGDFGAKTQAALAQFQLSRTIPASGQLDDETLSELGVDRGLRQASAGASGPEKEEVKHPAAQGDRMPGND